MHRSSWWCGCRVCETAASVVRRQLNCWAVGHLMLAVVLLQQPLAGWCWPQVSNWRVCCGGGEEAHHTSTGAVPGQLCLRNPLALATRIVRVTQLSL